MKFPKNLTEERGRNFLINQQGNQKRGGDKIQILYGGWNQKQVIGSIGVGMVVKTDDGIYVLSTIKIYNNYFPFVFSVV